MLRFVHSGELARSRAHVCLALSRVAWTRICEICESDKSARHLMQQHAHNSRHVFLILAAESFLALQELFADASLVDHAL